LTLHNATPDGERQYYQVKRRSLHVHLSSFFALAAFRDGL
jgi:hypothetical protein